MTESKICTCPSGDGSLRHPCPAHPAVEQAGGDERAVDGKPRATRCPDCGESDLMPGDLCTCGYETDPAAGYACSECDGSGDGYVGEVCRECDGTGWFVTPEQARAALAQPSPAQAEAEAERPEVVAYRTIGRHEKHQHPHYALNYYKQNAEDQAAHWRERGCEVSEDELMTVAQHDRIFGALRADRDSWAEQAEQRLADWDEMRKERDAALAEVERLRQFERICEGLPQDAIDGGWTVQGIRCYAKRLEDQLKSALARVAELTANRNRYGVDAHYFNKNLQRILRDFESFTPDELARSLIILAKVADEKVVAQHSVPEASEQEKEQGWTLDYRFVELVTEIAASRTEFTTSMEATEQVLLAARELLAAAPDKEVPQAWLDVRAERRRQIEAKGWTPEHDDLYCSAELPRAAAAYILNGANDEAPAIWPFVAKWWKPRDARSNYVRAGALILAEIERLDRAAHGKEVGHE
ncbi:hypothetical protein ACQ1XD_006736 [Pseudomonas aeruginosa]|uniref:Hypothetical phage protein n=1 Tax=Pseudomonas aeruginosa TaxID=287 RepID=B3G2K2_PSEAI|nr:hypothetical protein [Pseudomonas aeruginosa]ACD39264.1 hypothetical phage protein [Pseudomonas aeruginosa]MCC0499254.1 hypothetical protein [Pseudomonas aeruginosa]